MAKPAPLTPLIALLRACTPDQREQLATLAGTSASYLYALGSCCRDSCRSELASRIEDASRHMHRMTKGVTPVVTMRELATMCSLKKKG